MDFMFATAPIPAGTALPSKWRSLILSLIVQRRRQNTFHSKDLCEYRRPNSDIRTPRVPTPIQPRVRCQCQTQLTKTHPSLRFRSALRATSEARPPSVTEIGPSWNWNAVPNVFGNKGGTVEQHASATIPRSALAWPPPSCDDTCVSLYLVCTTLARQSAALNPSRPRRIRRDPWPSAAFY